MVSLVQQQDTSAYQNAEMDTMSKVKDVKMVTTVVQMAVILLAQVQLLDGNAQEEQQELHKLAKLSVEMD